MPQDLQGQVSRARPGRWAWALAIAAALVCSVAAAAPASVYLEDLTWTEVQAAVRSGQTIVIVPIGGTEQSGPHIALGKHNVRVRILAGEIARTLGATLVAPVVAYVPEGAVAPPSSHMRYAGTLSVPDAVFEQTLIAAGDSLRAHGFRLVVFIGDHGGYQKAIAHAVARMNQAWGRASARALAPPEYYAASTEGFAQLLRARGYRDDEIGTHAALADTSLQLAVAPETVRREVLDAGIGLDTAHGVYGGNPKRASAELGRLGTQAIVDATVAAIRQAAAAR